jgi:uracil-DNA glycosylase family 4
MFTGDSSGDTLTAAMYRAGFSNQPHSWHREDGLVFHDAYLTAVVRCAPPGNRPTAQEIANCHPFLMRELELLSRVQIVIALGRIAFDGYRRILRVKGREVSKLAFSHGVHYRFNPSHPDLVVCYHPSRQNTQTGRLTDEMIDQVFAQVRRLIAQT